MKMLHRRRGVTGFVWASLALSMAGCSGPGSTPDSSHASLEAAPVVVVTSGSVRPAIFGGRADETDSAVVAVQTNGCTGTLIAPNIVLTAHHCVAQVEPAKDCATSTYGPPRATSRITISTLPSIGVEQAGAHAVVEIVTLPDPLDPERLCGDDLALIALRVPIDPSEVMPIVPRVDGPIAVGEPFSAIGFGRRSNDTTEDPRRIRQRRDGVNVTCAGLACPRDENAILSREWVGKDESCAGDSGGAAVDAVGRLIGVHNRGASTQPGTDRLACSGTSVYIHLAAHAAWLKSEVARLSTKAGLVPPPWSTGFPTDPRFAHAIGATCSSDASCPSQLCIQGSCTRECNEAATCPADYRCDSASSVCRAVAPPVPTAAAPDAAGASAAGCAIGRASAGAPSTRLIGSAALFVALTLMARRRRACGER